jgi:hypothetical protein
MGVFLSKETLFWVPFSIDLSLCLIQFPMFLIKGPQWFAQVMGGGEDDDGSSKKKKNIVVPPVDSAYAMLYDTFLLCYSGYCAMMFYGLYSVLRHPDTLLPPFAGVMFCVILAKEKLMSQWESRGKHGGDGGNGKLRKKKQDSLLYIYVPTYGGYCFLYALERYRESTA